MQSETPYINNDPDQLNAAARLIFSPIVPHPEILAVFLKCQYLCVSCEDVKALPTKNQVEP